MLYAVKQKGWVKGYLELKVARTQSAIKELQP